MHTCICGIGGNGTIIPISTCAIPMWHFDLGRWCICFTMTFRCNSPMTMSSAVHCSRHLLLLLFSFNQLLYYILLLIHNNIENVVVVVSDDNEKARDNYEQEGGWEWERPQQPQAAVFSRSDLTEWQWSGKKVEHPKKQSIQKLYLDISKLFPVSPPSMPTYWLVGPGGEGVVDNNENNIYLYYFVYIKTSAVEQKWKTCAVWTQPNQVVNEGYRNWAHWMSMQDGWWTMCRGSLSKEMRAGNC